MPPPCLALLARRVAPPPSPRPPCLIATRLVFHRSQLKRLALPREAAGSGKSKPDARSLVVQLHDHFSYRGHLCLLFEPLGVNLLQLLQQNQCKGLSCSLIRYFSKQLLQVLALLREMGIIHCDLKPENVLLQNLHSPAIK